MFYSDIMYMTSDDVRSMVTLTLEEPRVTTPNKEQGESTSLRLSGSALRLRVCSPLTTT